MDTAPDSVQALSGPMDVTIPPDTVIVFVLLKRVLFSILMSDTIAYVSEVPSVPFVLKPVSDLTGPVEIMPEAPSITLPLPEGESTMFLFSPPEERTSSPVPAMDPLSEPVPPDVTGITPFISAGA